MSTALFKEVGYALSKLIDDIEVGGWVVAEDSFKSKTGAALEFQAQIGCGWECFGCYGPYQLRDGESAYDDETITSELWWTYLNYTAGVGRKI